MHEGVKPHDPELLDQLVELTTNSFDEIVWRSTRINQEPAAFSHNGGRWAPPSNYQSVPVLYTSLLRDGAIAEMTNWLSALTPRPTKPILVHQLRVRAQKVVSLDAVALQRLGVDMERYQDQPYARMGQTPASRSQEIGSALSFLGIDGLLVPSARWDCQNLVLYDNLNMAVEIDVLSRAEVDWISWMEASGMPKPD